jgi:hypothetical protein
MFPSSCPLNLSFTFFEDFGGDCFFLPNFSILERENSSLSLFKVLPLLLVSSGFYGM